MTVLHQETQCSSGQVTGTGAVGARGEPLQEREAIDVVPWPDPVIDALGHDPRSWYVEQFWLPVLGPTSTWLVRRIAARFDDGPDGFPLALDEAARSLGLGGRSGRHSPFARAIGRCVTFELARWQDPSTLAMRRSLPPLPRRHILRLPPGLQGLHESWSLAQRRIPLVEQLRRRSRRLALGLVELGDGQDDIELQLVRWHVHPALAHEAAVWALAGAMEDEPTPDTV
ncbi:MAG: hypothetical protein ACYDD6_05565 [Acidimicrobiales bacterium]